MVEYQAPKKVMPAVIPAIVGDAANIMSGVNREDENHNIVLMMKNDKDRAAVKEYIEQHFNIKPLSSPTGVARRAAAFEQLYNVSTLVYSAHTQVKEDLQQVPGLVLMDQNNINLSDNSEILRQLKDGSKDDFSRGKTFGV